jgi:hypothetical protein
MALGIVVIGVIALVIAIYLIFELKRMKHKIFAIFLIALILFAFFSFNAVFKGKNITITNVTDLENAGKLYFSWLGAVFNNMKILTTNAIEMDWQNNKTA